MRAPSSMIDVTLKHRVGNAADQIGRHLGAVKLGQVALDLAHGHAGECPKFCVRDFCEDGFWVWYIENEASAAR